ncbi:MAG: phasin [Pseudolabrys sp.]
MYGVQAIAMVVRKGSADCDLRDIRPASRASHVRKSSEETPQGTKTTTAKPTSYPKVDTTQAFRATAENGSAQVKESFEKMSATTAEATALIKDSYSTAVKGAQEYNTRFIEFAQNNTKAAFDFVQKLSGVKSPSDFFELSTDHSREQFETLTEQTRELAALAQKVTLATVEPLKTGVTKAFGQPT